MSKGTAPGQGEKDRVPGKRGVTTSANSGAILGSARLCRGAPPRPAFCHYGDGRFRTLLGGKSVEGLVHGSVAQIPRRGAVSLTDTHH